MERLASDYILFYALLASAIAAVAVLLARV